MLELTLAFVSTKQWALNFKDFAWPFYGPRYWSLQYALCVDFVWLLNIKLWAMRIMILKLKFCNNLWAQDEMGYRSWIWNVHWMLKFKIGSNWALLTSSWLQPITHSSPFMSITLFQDLGLWTMTLHIWIWCKVVKIWFATCFVH
jgi:hypothetical protein